MKFKEEDITGLRPDQICQRGISRTFQISRVLKVMTPLENIMLAFKDQRGESIMRGILNPLNVKEQEKRNLKKALEILETMKLYDLRNGPAAIL